MAIQVPAHDPKRSDISHFSTCFGISMVKWYPDLWANHSPGRHIRKSGNDRKQTSHQTRFLYILETV